MSTLIQLIDELLLVQAQVVASEHQGADLRQRVEMRRSRDEKRAEIERRATELEAQAARLDPENPVARDGWV